MVVALAAASLTLSGCTSDRVEKLDTPALAEGNLPAELVASMESVVNTAIAGAGASGAIVGVWVPWSGSWVAGVGTTELGGSKPMDPEMTFRIGEITRSMTCDVLYGMVADGIVKLTTPVADLVSGVPNLADITLGQLCDSTSGLGALPQATRDRMLSSLEREWGARELASFGLGKGTVAAPGERYVESDTGYLLLGLALERASGLTPQKYLAKYVTTPLGLDNTTLPGDAAAAPGKNSPHGYLTQNTPEGWACASPTDVTEISATTGWTNAGVVADITDVGLYARALAEQTLDRGNKTDRYDSPLPMSDGFPSWFTGTGGVQFAGSLMGYGGSTIGYATAAWSDPETGVTIAVMVNNSTNGAGLVRSLAFQLAALAATAPAAAGQAVPEFGVPWTIEAEDATIRNGAICPIP